MMRLLSMLAVLAVRGTTALPPWSWDTMQTVRGAPSVCRLPACSASLPAGLQTDPQLEAACLLPCYRL